MSKYKLTQKLHEGATKATLGGKEYAVKDGIVEFPDDRDVAHEQAKLIGGEAYFGKPEPAKPDAPKP